MLTRRTAQATGFMIFSFTLLGAQCTPEKTIIPESIIFDEVEIPFTYQEQALQVSVKVSKQASQRRNLNSQKDQLDFSMRALIEASPLIKMAFGPKVNKLRFIDITWKELSNIQIGQDWIDLTRARPNPGDCNLVCIVCAGDVCLVWCSE